MVVENGVDEGVAELGVVQLTAGLVRGDGAVLLALSAADVAPVASVGDIPEFLHVHVYERAWVIVLVATDWFARGAVNVGEPVQTRRGQDAMDRRRGNTRMGRELHWPVPQSHSQVHAALRHRLGRLVLRRPRPRRAALHRLACQIAVDPALRGRPGHLETSGH